MTISLSTRRITTWSGTRMEVMGERGIMAEILHARARASVHEQGPERRRAAHEFEESPPAFSGSRSAKAVPQRFDGLRLRLRHPEEAGLPGDTRGLQRQRLPREAAQPRQDRFHAA